MPRQPFDGPADGQCGDHHAVAGTDGSDGPTTAAGGLVDGNTWSDPEAARLALQKADAGSYLEQHDSLFVTGPTNTNVMDLIIAIVD